MRSSPMAKAAAAFSILALAAIAQVRSDEPKTDTPGRLEFRILADTKHDRDAAEQSKKADTREHPPAGYRWVWLGEAVTGADPKVDRDTLTDPGARWKENEFVGQTVRLDGLNEAGTKVSAGFQIERNTADTLTLRQDAALFLKSVSTYRIENNPSGLDTNGGNTIVREVTSAPGRVQQWVLVKLDRHELTEQDVKRAYPTVDERFKPAIGFELSPAGAEKMGALTREHLPEEGGTFRYRMGFILDGRLLSAPVILDEIRAEALIQLGSNATPEERDRILRVLRGSAK